MRVTHRPTHIVISREHNANRMRLGLFRRIGVNIRVGEVCVCVSYLCGGCMCVCVCMCLSVCVCVCTRMRASWAQLWDCQRDYVNYSLKRHRGGQQVRLVNKSLMQNISRHTAVVQLVSDPYADGTLQTLCANVCGVFFVCLFFSWGEGLISNPQWNLAEGKVSEFISSYRPFFCYIKRGGLLHEIVKQKCFMEHFWLNWTASPIITLVCCWMSEWTIHSY